MAWIVITEALVKSRISTTELDALRTTEVELGQVDPLTEIIEGVSNEMRGHIAACDRNKLGAGATIPESLLHAAMAMIRFRMATRLIDVGLMSQDRRDENEAAIALLQRVAECKFGIETPVTETDEEIGSVSPRTAARELNFSKERQDGI